MLHINTKIKSITLCLSYINQKAIESMPNFPSAATNDYSAP